MGGELAPGPSCHGREEPTGFAHSGARSEICRCMACIVRDDIAILGCFFCWLGGFAQHKSQNLLRDRSIPYRCERLAMQRGGAVLA